MDKNFKISVLLDVYGALLTENRRTAIRMYYDEDLSLAEIAEHLGISRQGVRDSIKHGEAELNNFEKKLGLMNKNDEIQDLIDEAKLMSENKDLLNILSKIENKL